MSHQSTLPPPAQARLQLVVNTGQRSEAYPLFDDAVVNVGRDSDNVIRIDDASVSRRHLQVQATEDGAFVVDLGSSNGTFVRIDQETPLETGDLVLVGEQLLRIDPA